MNFVTWSSTRFILGLYPLASNDSNIKYLLGSFINAMVVNIGDGFDQYCVTLIMVQNKESDTAINLHEGEISDEVIVDDTTDFIGKGAKTKYICNRFVFRIDFDTFQPHVLYRPGIGLRFFIILWKKEEAQLGVMGQVWVVRHHPLCWLSCL